MKSNKYLETISLIEYSEFGEPIESVSINDAFIACDIRELETLENIKNNVSELDTRIAELNKKLKNIKYK